jgi:ribosomal protein S4E
VGRHERRRPLLNIGVDGKIILKWIFKKLDGVMDLINLAQDRDRWRILLNAVMNVRFHKTRGISCLAEPVSFSRRTLLREVS